MWMCGDTTEIYSPCFICYWSYSQIESLHFKCQSIVIHLPTTDSSSEIYNEYLIELQNISVLQSDGPVRVTGDFNAHLEVCVCDML